jgi:hypothetical protein
MTPQQIPSARLMSLQSGAPNAANHPPGDNCIVRQVDNKRQAISGRVHWLVRPPLGSDTSAQQIISACFGSLLPGVPNAELTRREALSQAFNPGE